MEYIYAGLILNESGAEINEDNLTAVLEAADVDVEESRVKALVAALEDVDIDDAIAEAAAVPAAGGAAPAPAAEGDDVEEAGEEPEEEAADDDEEDEEDEEASGEGLGALFG